DHFDSIGLLMYQSRSQSGRQDEPVTKLNVKLHSLGAPGRMWDRLERMRRLREVCAAAGPTADGLLIRGVTPRQIAVWQSTPVAPKAFLLVGSPKPTKMSGLSSIYPALRSRQRFLEIQRIASDGTTMLANSPALVEEMADLLRIKAQFVPTNSLSASEMIPL